MQNITTKIFGLFNYPERFWLGVSWLCWVLHLVVDTVVDFIFHFVYDDANRKIVSTIKHSFLIESATSLAEKIRTKQLTSEKLVKCCFERIQEINPYLNCIVDTRFKDALEEAKKADEFIATTTLSYEELKRTKPFLGVPFTSKESTHAEGMNNTFGLVCRTGIKATVDADIVASVKAGGGILLGVGNIPELIWQESRNNVYGQTNNPYNVHRTVGGSSGGDAAAVAACASPFAIATDASGSTRIPSYFCGIVGHKPTTGLIGTKGLIYFTGEEKDKTITTAGTLTRYTEDITPFLKLLVGENVTKLQLDTKVDLKKLKLSYINDLGELRMSHLCRETKDILQRAVFHLEEICNSKAKKLKIRGFKLTYSIWRYWMNKEEADGLAFDLGNRKFEVSVMTELPKLLLGKSDYTLPSILQLIEKKLLPPISEEWAQAETLTLKEELMEELCSDGVLLFPSYPSTAPHHYVPFFRPYNFLYWAIINVLHFPATQVPLGLNRVGLPLGIQVVAAPYNDHLCIAVAQELERAFGGYVPPFAVNK